MPLWLVVFFYLKAIEIPADSKTNKQTTNFYPPLNYLKKLDRASGPERGVTARNLFSVTASLLRVGYGKARPSIKACYINKEATDLANVGNYPGI